MRDRCLPLGGHRYSRHYLPMLHRDACADIERRCPYRAAEGASVSDAHKGIRMATRKPSDAHLSTDEIHDAISELSDADWHRLRRVADTYAWSRAIEAKDLLHEVFVRALDGRRNCPRNVDVVRFLAEAMRSIASSEEKARQRQPEMDAETEPEDEQQPTVEDTCVEVQRRSTIVAMFEDDDVAQVLVEGIMEGMEGEDLRALTELNKTEFNSKRRKIRRRINNHLKKDP